MPRPRQRNALMSPDAGEADNERAKFREEIAAQIPLLFGLAKIVLGEEEAQRRWKATLAKTRDRGRPKGPKNPEKDRYLLLLYDELADAYPSQIKGLPRFIGKLAHWMNKHDTPTAIAVHVRRLLKARLKLPIGRGLINRPPR